MGCMVGVRDDDLRRRFPYVDVFARPQDFSPIMEVAGLDDSWRRVLADDLRRARRADGVRPRDPRLRQVLHLLHRPLPPRPREEPHHRRHPNEVEHYCARGVKEVTLLGQTVEAYGHDLEVPAQRRPDLGDLMRAIHDTAGLERIRFLTSYPKDMTRADHRRRRRAAEGLRELQHPGAGRRRRACSSACAAATRSPNISRSSTWCSARMPGRSRWSRTSSSASAARPRRSSSTPAPSRTPPLRQGARRRILASSRHHRPSHAR